MKYKLSQGMLAVLLPVLSHWCAAASATVVTSPLGLSQQNAALVLINMENSRNMYFEAVDGYSDYTDDDGDGAPDGKLDQDYRPLFVYEGYFNSKVCYQYNNDRFEPSAKLDNLADGCHGLWHGNFLNYLSMSRLDLARNALYGGKRVLDTVGAQAETVLERAFIPQNAHAWAKSLNSLSDLTRYTPYSTLTQDGEHRYIFVNVTPLGENAPKIKVLKNTKLEEWQWLARERPVAGDVIESMDNALDIAFEVDANNTKAAPMTADKNGVGLTSFDISKTDVSSFCQLKLSDFDQHIGYDGQTIGATNPGILYFNVASPTAPIQTLCNEANSNNGRGEIDPNLPYVISVHFYLDTANNNAIDYSSFRYYGFGPTRLTFKHYGGGIYDVIEHKTFKASGDTSAYEHYNKADYGGWTFAANSSTEIIWNMVQKYGGESDTYELKAQLNGGKYCDSQDIATQGIKDGDCHHEHLRWGVYKGSLPADAVKWTEWQDGVVKIYQLPRYDDQIDTFKARVQVCATGTHEDYLHERCQGFPEGAATPDYYKPEGLLQRYSREHDTTFAIMTGSYGKNKSGGILRQNAANFLDTYEKDNNGDYSGQFASTVTIVSADGTTSLTEPSSITQVLDQLKAVDFSETATIALEGGNNNGKTSTGNYQYANCNFLVENGTITPDVGFKEGQCVMWGNPLSEMLAEGLNFLGQGISAVTANANYQPTNALYADQDGSGKMISDQPVTWRNPYDVQTKTPPQCRDPYQIVLSSVLPSYDDNPVVSVSGGNVFDKQALSAELWDFEFGGSRSVFVVDTTDKKYQPVVKESQNSFAGISGTLDEVSRQGTYYSAAVAYYGRTNKVSGADNASKKSVKTMAVALSAPFPQIQFEFDDGKITVIPFAKSVDGSGFNNAQMEVDSSEGKFQTPNQIVDLAIDDIQYNGNSLQKLVLRVNFDDTEQGRDLDQDTVVLYTMEKTAAGRLQISVQPVNSSGTQLQHLGYIIHGTNGQDGTHLVVRDCDTDVSHLDSYGWASADEGVLCTVNQEFASTDTPYYGDSPLSQRQALSGLPSAHRHTFIPANSNNDNEVTLLQDPLWYAAKFGGFEDGDNGTKDHFDADDIWTNNGTDPLAYFKVGNGKGLKEQLDSALSYTIKYEHALQNAALSPVSLLLSGQYIVASYQAVQKDSDNDWEGDIKFVDLSSDAQINDISQAPSAKDQLVSDANRKIYTSVLNNGSYDGVSFTVANVDKRLFGLTDDLEHAALLNYLRGARSDEIGNAACYDASCQQYRNRGDSVLGDIVNSVPVYAASSTVGANIFDASYNTFKNYLANTVQRPEMVYVGANDGMLHGFRATKGPNHEELLAYIPHALLSKLPALAEPNYVNQHQFYVDVRPTVQDAQDLTDSCDPKTAQDGCWFTALVGGLGAGGAGLYALNVTDPETFTAGDVLWDIDHTTPGFEDLGYTFSRPSIVKTKVKGADRWVVIVGNGYYNNAVSNNGSRAVLYVIDLVTGNLIAKYRHVSNDSKYGMSTPIAIDFFNTNVANFSIHTGNYSPDGYVDLAYAGDLSGHIWRFDLTLLNDPSSFNATLDNGQSYVLVVDKKDPEIFNLLITGTDDTNSTPPRTAPITMKPEVVFNMRDRKPMVVFGTGQYFEMNDDLPKTTAGEVNSLYGVIDSLVSDAQTLKESDLYQNQIQSTNVKAANDTSYWKATRTITTANAGLSDKAGWFLRLKDPSSNVDTGYRGELMYQDVGVSLGGQLLFTSFVAQSDASCNKDGYSWLYAIQPATGGVDLEFFDDGASLAEGKLSSVVNVVTDSNNDGEYESKSYVNDSQGMRVIDSSSTKYGRRAWRQLQ